MYVWLKDGALLYGWPHGFSSTRREAAELALAEVHRWDPEKEEFVAYPDPDITVLIDLSNISHIELHPRQYPDPSRFPALARWRRFWFGFP